MTPDHSTAPLATFDFQHWLEPIRGMMEKSGSVAIASGTAAVALSDVPYAFWVLTIICGFLLLFLALLAALRTIVFFEFRAHTQDEDALVQTVKATGDSFDIAAKAIKGSHKELGDRVEKVEGAQRDQAEEIGKLRKDVDHMKGSRVWKLLEGKG